MSAWNRITLRWINRFLAWKAQRLKRSKKQSTALPVSPPAPPVSAAPAPTPQPGPVPLVQQSSLQKRWQLSSSQKIEWAMIRAMVGLFVSFLLWLIYHYFPTSTSTGVTTGKPWSVYFFLLWMWAGIIGLAIYFGRSKRQPKKEEAWLIVACVFLPIFFWGFWSIWPKGYARWTDSDTLWWTVVAMIALCVIAMPVFQGVKIMKYVGFALIAFMLINIGLGIWGPPQTSNSPAQLAGASAQIIRPELSALEPKITTATVTKEWTAIPVPVGFKINADRKSDDVAFEAKVDNDDKIYEFPRGKVNYVNIPGANRYLHLRVSQSEEVESLDFQISTLPDIR